MIGFQYSKLRGIRTVPEPASTVRHPRPRGAPSTHRLVATNRLAALLWLALAACLDPRTRTEVRIGGNLGGLTSLDPAQVADAPTFQVLSNMYEALAGLDSEMHIVPILAESWSEDADRTWVFSLLHGVRFHDGAELTASEVKRALERSSRSPRRR